MQVNTQFPEQQHPEEITIKSLKARAYTEINVGGGKTCEKRKNFF